AGRLLERVAVGMDGRERLRLRRLEQPRERRARGLAPRLVREEEEARDEPLRERLARVGLPGLRGHRREVEAQRREGTLVDEERAERLERGELRRALRLLLGVPPLPRAGPRRLPRVEALLAPVDLVAARPLRHRLPVEDLAGVEDEVRV